MNDTSPPAARRRTARLAAAWMPGALIAAHEITSPRRDRGRPLAATAAGLR